MFFRWNRTASWFVWSLVGLMCALHAGGRDARAYEADARYKLGDHVEVEHFGEWKQGVVTEVLGNDWVRVRAEDDDGARTYPPRKVRPSKKRGSAPASDNPFATAEEKEAAAEFRTWSDQSGQFEVVAKLLEVADEKVVLEREDGQEIRVPLARLSDADRRYVEDPDAPAEEDDGEIEITKTDLNRAKLADLSPSETWSYSPDPAPAGEAELPAVRLTLGKKLNFFEKPIDLFLLPQSKQAYAIFHLDGHGRDGSGVRVFACDLAQKKLDGVGAFPANQLPVAISSDGKWVVAREHRFGFGNSATLCLHALEGKQLTPKVAWQPYHHVNGLDRDVQWATLVQDDALLTVSGVGQVALWRIPDLQPVWLAHGKRGATPTLSAGGRVVAVPGERGIALLEAMTGKKLGFLPTDTSGLGPAPLAFDRRGERLAMCSRGRFRVWDLLKQTVIRDFAIPFRIGGERLDWIDERTVLVGGRYLVDIDCRVWLWDYEKTTPATRMHGDRLWYVAEGVAKDELVLASAKLPDDGPRQLLTQVDPDSLLVVKPGMTVSISLSISGDKKREVTESLTKRLEEAGLKVSDQGELKLVGSIRPGETHELEIREFGSFKSTTHKATAERLELEYQLAGQTVWKYSTETFPPGFLEMQKNESISQALAREMKQNPDHFNHIWLPGYVARNEEGRPLGRSDAPSG